MAKVKVTEKEFAAYVKVQMSGKTNMFDVRVVAVLSGLSKNTILAIMDQYDSLCDKFPKVVA